MSGSSPAVLFVFLNAECGTCNSYVANAFYSGAKGAQLTNVSELGGDVWIVDCTAEINVTFKIGGQSYPIHPLDITREVVSDGETTCYGTVRLAYPQRSVCWADQRAFKFQPVTPGAIDPTFDGILGMTFCKWMA